MYQGKYNVAFVYMCNPAWKTGTMHRVVGGKSSSHSDRIPDAAPMTRSTFQARKAAEALGDPEEYPNLFEDWQITHEIKAKVAKKLYISCVGASTLRLNNTEQSCNVLVKKFKKSQIGETLVGNGDPRNQGDECGIGNPRTKTAIEEDADSANGVMVINDILSVVNVIIYVVVLLWPSS
ncbi:putative coatomer subunit beta-3-like [Sesbania bispinosa]|nr:putative coatomer subunit beta-3-like [Sesbania bispinosa]